MWGGRCLAYPNSIEPAETAPLEVRLDCVWALYEIVDAHQESLDVEGVALADQFEGPGAVRVISQGLVAVNTLE